MALCRVSAFPFILTKGKRSGQSALVSVSVGTPAQHMLQALRLPVTPTHTRTDTPLFQQVLTLLATSRGDASLCILTIQWGGGGQPPKLSYDWLMG